MIHYQSVEKNKYQHNLFYVIAAAIRILNVRKKNIKNLFIRDHYNAFQIIKFKTCKTLKV